MRHPRTSAWILIAGVWLTGCATIEAPSSPAARKSSPSSVSLDHPGGDAAHPVDAALERLLREPLGQHVDAWKTLRVQLPDRPHWKGTRFKRYPTRAAYQYGKAYVGVAIVIYTKASAVAGDADARSACLRPLLKRAHEAAQGYSVEMGPMRREVRRRGGLEMLVVRTSGKFNTLFKRDAYVGALVAHQSWPGTCLVQGFAVRVGSDVMLARQVVTRWVEDAAPEITWSSKLSVAPRFENR